MKPLPRTLATPLLAAGVPLAVAGALSVSPALAAVPWLDGPRKPRIAQPTWGGEVHKVNYFGYPDVDSVFKVADEVDRGAGFSAPTDYPSQRHVAYTAQGDTYWLFYEWNEANNFRITGHYWQAIGGVGFWSFALDLPEPEGVTYTDMGRPSAHASDQGIAVAFHATKDGSEYDTHWSVYDRDLGTFTTTEIYPTDGSSATFPFLDRSSDGVWMVVVVRGDIPDPSNTLAVATSTDNGVTWNFTDTNPNVTGSWRQPSGAADPTNGDLYVVYHSDPESDTNSDIMIQRSTDGGATWSPPQVVTSGVPGGEVIAPSAVVDQNHVVHIVCQGNLVDSYSDQGVTGFEATGPTGVPWYVRGSFDGDTWTTELRQELNSRENLAGIPDSLCGPTDIILMATDSLTGLPNIGIHHGPEGHDILYATYTQPIYAEASDQGYLICGSWQTWMQKYDLVEDSYWQDRVQVSDITNEEIEAGRAAIYAHITHEVPAGGPGIEWSEMDNAAAPAAVYFNRPEIAMGISGDTPEAPAGAATLAQNTPNPFNPSTVIRYSLPEAGEATLRIYDAAGRSIRTLANGRHEAGVHEVPWDGHTDTGAPVASGVYFYRLETGATVLTRSMLLVK